jgi:hypothetical protein
VEAWPAERINLSRFGQIGSSGSNRRKSCHNTYTTGAIAIGVPGWPEFACWTASMLNVRMVLIERESMVCMSKGNCGSPGDAQFRRIV